MQATPCQKFLYPPSSAANVFDVSKATRLACSDVTLANRRSLGQRVVDVSLHEDRFHVLEAFENKVLETSEKCTSGYLEANHDLNLTSFMQKTS